MSSIWSALWLLIASSAAAKVLPLTTESELSAMLNIYAGMDKTCILGDVDASACSESLNLLHLQQLSQYMRPDLDPCVDFHAYACGNWRSVNGIKQAESESAMALSGRRINERYVQLFERLRRSDDAPSTSPERRDRVFSQLLRYYETCTASEDKGRLQLQGYMEQLEGSLPPPATHWLELLAHFGRYGYSGHFLRIAISQHNATRHDVVIQAHDIHSASLKLTPQIFAVLRRHTLRSRSQLRRQFAQLEAELVQIVTRNAQHSDDDTVRYYRLEQLKLELPSLDWQRALEQQLGRRLPPSHWLLVDELPALRQLAEYLNQADPLLLRLYTLARFLQYLLERPHNPLASSAGATPINCVRHMRKTLYLVMNYAYEQSYYAEQRARDERVLHSVFAALKTQFAQTLAKNELELAPALVRAMLAKLRGVRLNLGNMPRNVSAQFYAQWAQRLMLSDNFYANHLQSLLQYHAQLAEQERSSDVADSIWYSFNHHGPELMDNIDATPYFYCLGSIIIIPYAYLQLPFYDAAFWPALLYGDLANTLGHELLHTFDTYFVDYDASGNMRDYSGQLLRSNRYLSQVRCLNDSSVEVLNERVADIGGTRLALQTYMTRPGAEYRRANGRLYFLQFAQFFCGDDGDVYHDAGSKRLNYTLAQMPEFAEVFECAAGAPMNPEQRCSYW